MIEIDRSSLEGRIIDVLMEVYPITVKDLQDELNISEKSLELGIKRLQTRGIIELETLPGKVYIRLIRRDFKFIGRNASQRTAIKRKGRGKGKLKDYDGYAYG
jgi:DNA-binding transcriptional regulator GbsR (MarR family)